MHLREDRRHIQDRDVMRVAEHVECRLNLEMAATPEMVDIATQVRPHDCCLVPERRDELTTEGGLDVVGQEEALSEVCAALREAGIRVSLFIDARDEQIAAASRVAADAVELHTGPYADATTDALAEAETETLTRAARLASNAGLLVNAGHGLHYHNVRAIAEIPGIRELNIGHAIIARSVMTGLPAAVAEMKQLLRDAADGGSRIQSAG